VLPQTLRVIVGAVPRATPSISSSVTRQVGRAIESAGGPNTDQIVDDKQKVFVDITSPKGRALHEGLFTGKTRYPNEYLAHTALGHNLWLAQSNSMKKEGLRHLTQALHDCPSPAPMREILAIGRAFPELQPRITEVCQRYALPLEKEKVVYARQDGYSSRLQVARMALAHMEQVAGRAGDARSAQASRDEITLYDEEIDRLVQQTKW
jgi:hypothetical protein